jgi:hypothetical protein
MKKDEKKLKLEIVPMYNAIARRVSTSTNANILAGGDPHNRRR